MTVFLNVRPIFPENNLPLDQTNKEFHLLLIFKNELLNFVLYFIKELYMFYFFREKLYAVFISNIAQKSRYVSCFIKELFTYFYHFASALKTEKQTSLYFFKLKYLICVHCNICFNFYDPYYICFKTLDKANFL